MPNLTAASPPGIQEKLKHVVSGGHDHEWLPLEKRKYYTNAFVVKDNKILLGYKKRGFGKHKYNGFGGKVEEGETILQAAVRELEEEAGITAPLQYAGTLLFLTKGLDLPAFHIEIFRADEYSGIITESDEMRPQWFSIPSYDSKTSAIDDLCDIPFGQMWDIDPHWMPLLLSRTIFVGRADFSLEGEVFSPRKWWIGVTSDADA